MTEAELVSLANALHARNLYMSVKQNIINIAVDYQANIIDKAAAGDALQMQFADLPKETAVAMFTFVLTQVDELIADQVAILDNANITEE